MPLGCAYHLAVRTLSCLGEVRTSLVSVPGPNGSVTRSWPGSRFRGGASRGLLLQRAALASGTAALTDATDACRPSTVGISSRSAESGRLSLCAHACVRTRVCARKEAGVSNSTRGAISIGLYGFELSCLHFERRGMVEEKPLLLWSGSCTELILRSWEASYVPGPSSRPP